MNTFAKVVVCVTAVITPAFAFAQDQETPLTRAQVKAELTRLERAGYSAASGENATYPADIQAAEAKVAAQQRADETNEAYGGMRSGGSAVGMAQRDGSLTRGASTCVGPAGFCVPFFGS